MRTTHSFTTQARRAQIVEATVRVIAREGLPKASFGRIAAEAGLSSPGMISYHFADKDELLTVLCDTILQGCVTSVDAAVSAADGLAAGLTAYVVAFIRWQDGHREEVIALWQLAAGWRRPGAQLAFDEAPLAEPLRAVLRDGQAAGVLRPLNEEWVAQTVLCAVKGYQQALHDDPDVDADAFAQTLVAVFAEGLLV
ncbi:TetR/AcrR family transcriptional regulator [Pseudactinotalea sp.]|uniref:TetR/AcrR family transcriptional regulator n=1 Tax=Pseudactinotalea sp. TaxID=1926260 RepID=UPI003B3AE8CC